MARNITQLFKPVAPADRLLKADDLVHVGRSSGTDFEKDAALNGIEIFNTVNSHGGLFGAPGGPGTLLGNTRTPVIDYAAEHGNISGLDPLAGTITVPKTGSYRVLTMMIFTNNQIDIGFSLWLQNNLSGDLIMGALDVPSKSNGFVSLSGETVVTLTAGEIINLALEADGAASLTFANASFDITPLALLA